MKKLLSVSCCVLYMHTITQSPLDVKVVTQAKSGEKVLIKALAIIVNREGNKKTPFRKIDVPSTECP